MSKHRLSRTIHVGSRRRRYALAGVLVLAVTAAMLGTMLPNSAADNIAIVAVADTTATVVPQDGDNSVKTTLATCPAGCDGNPNGGRDAVLAFAVSSVPANAVNLKARLQVHAWQESDALLTVHSTGSDAAEARPAPATPGPALAAIDEVHKGYNEWDVSGLVTGNGAYTLVLRQNGYDTRVYWASTENRNADVRPRLLLTYDLGAKPSPSTGPTAGPTGPASPSAVPVTTAPAPSSAAPSSVAPSSVAPKPTPTGSRPMPGAGCGTVSALLVPGCGAWWGMYTPTSASKGWDHGGAVAEVEAQVGRKFDLVHRYHDFSNAGSNGAFPDSYELAQMREGRLLFFAWESRNFSAGTTMRWSEVYGGAHDATIDAVAGRIKATGVPVFLGFDHEPEDEPAKGTDAEFVRAWRYVHDRFEKAGANNAIWVWTMMGWSGHYDRYAGLYPGDRYVDWVGYDPYNFFACNGSKGWKSPATAIGGFYRWLDENGIGGGKPRMLAEFGTNFDTADATAKRRWFEEFPAAVKAHPKIKAVIYFNSAGSTSRSSNCDMTMNHDASALAGFTSAGKDPYFRQPVRIP